MRARRRRNETHAMRAHGVCRMLAEIFLQDGARTRFSENAVTFYAQSRVCRFILYTAVETRIVVRIFSPSPSPCDERPRLLLLFRAVKLQSRSPPGRNLHAHATNKNSAPKSALASRARKQVGAS